jgi:hypothetical protein
MSKLLKSREEITDLRKTGQAVHPVPENKYGFIAYHTDTGRPIPDKILQEMYEKVLGPAVERSMVRS